ncbi:MAG TPA: MFS transporter [Streptosporangiaceae bacterium]|jgi:MFS family permease|nr:MFS transporter [Streptosporangiaceae bacterium]
MAKPNGWLESRTGGDVRDVYGRSYRLGPSDRVLLGYSRAWVAAAAWLVMLAVSGTQYGYGVFAARLMHSDGWGPEPVMWGFTLWITCHSVASGALPWLRRRYRLTSGQAVSAGAVGCGLGLLALSQAGNPILALAGYGVACGLGTGLVYGACVAIATAWYPDRPARTALVSGAFGYGAIPLILIAASVGDLALPLDMFAFAILTAAVVCVPFLREPPPRWWPDHLDPRRWAVDKSLNPALRHDLPAIREHSTREVLRCPVTRVMTALAVCIGSVALFDTAYLPSLGLAGGWRLRDCALALAAFAVGSGGVRTLALRSAGRIGRPRVVAVSMCAGAAAQLVLAEADTHHALALLWLASCCAGGAAGTWYALLPGLVRSCFGDQPGLPNLWLLYSAKAVGGVLGVGCAGWLIEAVGYPPVLIASAVLCLAAAGLAPLVRRPGLPRTLPGAAFGGGAMRIRCRRDVRWDG